jgi:esterase/lipase
MDNDKLFQLFLSRFENVEHNLEALNQSMNGKFTAFENKLDRLFTERNIICKDHDDRLDELTSGVLVIHTRLDEQSKAHQKRSGIYATIAGIAATVLSTLIEKITK